VPHAPVLRVEFFALSFPEFRSLPPRRNDERQVRAGLGLGDFVGMTALPYLLQVFILNVKTNCEISKLSYRKTSKLRSDRNWKKRKKPGFTWQSQDKIRM
jgi:hypothetical protein